MADRPLWEPDPKWSKPRRAAFEAYRDEPGRTFAAVARKLRKSGSLLRRWADEDNWRERVEAWDAEVDRRRREEFMEHSTDVAAEQAEAAAEFRMALLTPAQAVVARIAALKQDGKDPFDGVPLPELIRLSATSGRALAQVVHVERLARGMSTENRGGHDGGPLVPADVEAKSMEQLQAYLTGRQDERRTRERERP